MSNEDNLAKTISSSWLAGFGRAGLSKTFGAVSGVVAPGAAAESGTDRKVGPATAKKTTAEIKHVFIMPSRSKQGSRRSARCPSEVVTPGGILGQIYDPAAILGGYLPAGVATRAPTPFRIRPARSSLWRRQSCSVHDTRLLLSAQAFLWKPSSAESTNLGSAPPGTAGPILTRDRGIGPSGAAAGYSRLGPGVDHNEECGMQNAE